MQILDKEVLKDFSKTIDEDVLQSLLSGLKEAILNKVISIPLKQELSKSLGKYIDSELINYNITFNNKNELLLCLSEHFDIIKPLIDVCKQTRKHFADRDLYLELNKEKEDPNFFSISLGINCLSFDETEIIDIDNLNLSLIKSLSFNGVLFYLEPKFN